VTVGEGVPSSRALVDEARASVAEATQLLQQPDIEALRQSTASLAAAVERMERFQREAVAGADRGARSAIEELRSDLRRVRLLLGHAWEFRVRCSGQVVYTRKGELTASASAVGRWTFEA
jgi:hypothetical protein